MDKDKLVVRTYRIKKSQDEKIKKRVRYDLGESEQVRQAIDNYLKVDLWEGKDMIQPLGNGTYLVNGRETLTQEELDIHFKLKA